MVDTITQRASDFTNRDFDSWILELRGRANLAFPGWTDFNTANFGNVLLEMFSHTLDVLSFTQDQQHHERFVVFARLRRSMILLGKNVGFALPGAVAGTVDLEITFTDGQARADDLVVPSGTVITTAEGDVEFDLTQDALIPAGQIQIASTPAENARERSDSFVADGSPDLPVTLSSIPFLDGSADGNVVAGVETFDEVANFLQSGPLDLHFVVDVDEDDRGTIKFGDGINGKIPSGAGTVLYKTGGGASGNVDANTLVKFRDGNRFPTLTGENVQLAVRNPSSVADGVDRMSVEEARVAIPASLRTTGNRSVTTLDFEDNARKVRGVARAMMLTSDDDPSIPENTGKLYIVPVGGGLPSAPLKTQVLDFIVDEFPPTLTFVFSVEDPVLNVVSFDVEAFLTLGVTEPEARTAVEAALDAFFSLLDADGSQNLQIDFGFKIRTLRMDPGAALGEIPWSDIFNAVRDAETPAGVRVFRSVDEDTFVPADDVLLNDTEFPILGSILLTNSDTSTPF